MSTLYTYLNKLSDDFRSQNAPEIARLLLLKGVTPNLASDLLRECGDITNGRVTQFPEHFNQVIAYHLQCAYMNARGQFLSGFEAQGKALEALIKQIDLNDDASRIWFFEIMDAVLCQLRKTAIRAASTDNNDTKAELIMKLRALFGVLIRGDSRPRKMGVYIVINHLFKVYSRNKEHNGVLDFVKAHAADKNPLPELSEFPKSQAVTFKFFVGKSELGMHNFTEARVNLEYAWKYCLRTSAKNKKAILKYLIPTKLMFGVFPSRELLGQHGLNGVYGELTRAIKQGRPDLFESVFTKYESFLNESGLSFILIKTKLFTFRSILRKMYVILSVCGDSHDDSWKLHHLPGSGLTNPHHISFGAVNKYLQHYGTTLATGEIECMLANLLFHRLVKGYISHSNGLLVLARGETTAFPQTISLVTE